MESIKCIICNQLKSSSKEHIIPEALGNKELITYKVCEECNNKLGYKVDAYLNDNFFIKLLRKSENLKGKKEKEIKLLPGIIEDDKGKKYKVKDDKPIKLPEVKIENGTLYVDAQTLEEGIKLAKKKLKEMGCTDEVIEEIVREENCRRVEKKTNPTFKIEIDIDINRYLLAGVKMAYEFACEFLDDIYLQDEISITLRNILFEAISLNKEELSNYLMEVRIDKYACILYKTSQKVIENLKAYKEEFSPPLRHMCILHGSNNNYLICEIGIFLEKSMSITVLISEDAKKYNMQRKLIMAAVLEDGNCIIVDG